MAFTKEEIRQKALQLEQAGASSSKIREFVSLASQDLKAEDEGFFSKVRSSIGRRAEKLGEIVDRPQGLGSKAFQFAGQAAGGLLDIAGAGLSAVVPDIIEKPIVAGIEKGISSILESRLGQAGTQAFLKFKQENPEVAGNIEAALNIAAVTPFGKAGQIATRQAGQVAGKAGARLETGALSALQSKKQGFVRELISPVRTKKIKEAQVRRTTETGRGLTKRSIIEPTAQELAAEQVVVRIKGVSPNKTFQQNFNVIQDANRKASDQLVRDLRTNNFIFNESQLLSRLKGVKENLKANPAIVGDAEKTAEKLTAEISRRIQSSKKTGADLLEVRKDFDAWVKSQKGANIFDPTSENAFSIANREIRQSINDFIDERAVTNVKGSLREQSSLFRALDNVEVKAAIEADTAIGRILQRTGEILGTKNRIVQGVAAAVGIGGLGAAATFAPVAAVLGGLGLITFKAGKLVLSPQVRLQLAKLLKEIERVSKILTDPRKVRQLQLIEDDIKRLQ